MERKYVWKQQKESEKSGNEPGYPERIFPVHIGIPLRTLEDWEAGRRRPPEYIPRLIEYQIRYEELMAIRKGEERNAGES